MRAIALRAHPTDPSILTSFRTKPFRVPVRRIDPRYRCAPRRTHLLTKAIGGPTPAESGSQKILGLQTHPGEDATGRPILPNDRAMTNIEDETARNKRHTSIGDFDLQKESPMSSGCRLAPPTPGGDF